VPFPNPVSAELTGDGGCAVPTPNDPPVTTPPTTDGSTSEPPTTRPSGTVPSADTGGVEGATGATPIRGSVDYTG